MEAPVDAHILQRHHLDTFGQRVPLMPWLDQQSPGRIQIAVGVMKTAFEFRLQATLDLDCPEPPPGSARRRSISAPAAVR